MVEYVFFINFILNFLTIKTVAMLLKQKNSWLIFFAAFLGSCFNVSLQVYTMTTTGQILLQIGIAILQVCLCFKFKKIKTFLQIFLCFALCNLLYGGACTYLTMLLSKKSIFYVLAVFVVVFVAISFLAKKIYKKRAIENFCKDVEIENLAKKHKCKAFLDSGNLLFDPITHSPISFVNFRAFERLFPEISLEDILFSSKKIKSLKGAHYVEMKTLANSNHILVFQVEKMRVDGQVFENAFLGLVLKNFNSAFGTDMILHNSFAF